MKLPTGGLVSAIDTAPSDSTARITRPAVIVHSGPNGEPVVFQSADGEIRFDTARIKNIVKQQNDLITELEESYKASGRDIPIGAYPPVLDQHDGETTIMNVIGRMTGKLSFAVQDVPGVGPKCACALADVTFLGDAIVERVNDGRIYHLSIGIDEETDTLGELSAVITPAAAGAMLLKRGHKSKGDSQMSKKKLAAARTARIAKLEKAKAEIATLSKKLISSKQTVQLAKAKAHVSSRLTKLAKAGKITPAELKKVDLTRLAKLPEDALNTVIDTFESREPVINPRQHGSTAGIEFTEMAKQTEERQLMRLRAETRKSLRKMGAKLSESDDEKALAAEKESKEKDLAAAEVESDERKEKKKELAQEVKGMSKHLAALSKCLEDGDVEGAKKHLAEASDQSTSADGDEENEETEEATADLQTQVDELSTGLARIAGMVSDLMDAEDVESNEDGETEMAEGSDDDAQKDLSEDEKEKKKLAAKASEEDGKKQEEQA